MTIRQSTIARILRISASASAAVLMAGAAHAGIVSNGGGTFTDTTTGYKWMNVSTFYGDTYSQDQALILPGYHFATQTQMDQLETDTGLTTSTPDLTFISVAAAMGVPTPTPYGREIIWGVYGNGSDWAYIYGPENPVGYGWTDASIYDASWPDEGAFVTNGVATAAVPEPSSLPLLLGGLGLIGAALYFGRKRALSA